MSPEPIARKSPAPPQSEAARLTYRYDCMRASLHGVAEAGWITFGLLIAIRVFEAPDGWKAAISSAGFFGMLLNGVTLSLASRSGLRTTQLVALYLCGGGLCLLLAAGSINLGMFLVCFLGAHIIFAQQAPLMVEVYARNYSPRERGHRLSTVFLIVSIGGMLFSLGGGKLLDWRQGLWPGVLLLMGAGCLLNAFLVQRIPSVPLKKESSGNPFRNLSLMWKDRLFGVMLTAWMLLGFGNLMVLPLRVEYVANPVYGINASNETVALLTFVVPSILRMASTKVWGAFFDRMHFIHWRLCINACFLVSILIYFNTTSLNWLFFAAALDGLGKGGGMIGWNLWVTKIAPPEKVSAYMSVHTANTGLRGTIAPFVGYWLILAASPQLTSYCSAALMLISAGIFLALRRHPRFKID